MTESPRPPLPTVVLVGDGGRHSRDDAESSLWRAEAKRFGSVLVPGSRQSSRTRVSVVCGEGTGRGAIRKLLTAVQSAEGSQSAGWWSRRCLARCPWERLQGTRRRLRGSHAGLRTGHPGLGAAMKTGL